MAPNRPNQGAQRTTEPLEYGRWDRVSKTYICTAVNVTCDCIKCRGTHHERCIHTHKNKNELLYHQRHHGFDVDQVRRPVCLKGCLGKDGQPRLFQNNSNLRRHCDNYHQDGRTTGTGVFQCLVCGMSHKRRDNLKRHVVTCHERTPEEANKLVVRVRTVSCTSSPVQSEAGENEDEDEGMLLPTEGAVNMPSDSESLAHTGYAKAAQQQLEQGQGEGEVSSTTDAAATVAAPSMEDLSGYDYRVLFCSADGWNGPDPDTDSSHFFPQPVPAPTPAPVLTVDSAGLSRMEYGPGYA